MKERRLDKTAAVVINPVAGSSGRKGLEAADRLSEHGWEVSIYRTEGPGHATVLAKSESKKGTAVVFGAGGDGTYIELAKGLMQSETALAPLAAGTVCILPHELQLQSNPKLAVDQLVAGKIQTMDMGKIIGEELSEDYFLNLAGIGLDASVIQGLQLPTFIRDKRLLLPLGVARTMRKLPKHKATEVHIAIDSQKEIDGHLLQGWFANTRRIAYVTHRAEGKADDGVFEATLFKGKGSKGIDGVLAAGYLTHGVVSHKRIPFVDYEQGKHFSIRTMRDDKKILLQRDGDYIGPREGVNHIEITVVENALNILAPNREIEIFSKNGRQV